MVTGAGTWMHVILLLVTADGQAVWKVDALMKVQTDEEARGIPFESHFAR